MKKIISCTLLLITMMVSCSKKSSPEPEPPGPPAPPVDPPVTASYLTLAKQTHDFVTGNLLTQYGSYRGNTTTAANNAWEWYVVSQIYADAAMVGIGETSYLPYMNKTFQWMENMWDKGDSRGGYFSAVNLDGSNAGGDKFVDDNALTGMIYLEAYDVTTGTEKQAYLDKAKACGDWLVSSGLWDATYGGGFWWNTAKPNKPSQSNGLALQLFLRLYKLTGQTAYRDWAMQVDSWLTSKMFDPASGLFIWMYDGSGQGTRHTEKFTYDNAIMIEAYILYSQIMNDPTYLTKAQEIGNAMNRTLWNPANKMYIFNTDPTQGRVNPAWCGWGSQGMIRLYEADHNATWLTYAKGNIDGLNKATRNTTNYGYYFFANMDGTNRAPEMEGVDQSWMQRVQALMSKY